jgi:hypothetical protein
MLLPSTTVEPLEYVLFETNSSKVWLLSSVTCMPRSVKSLVGQLGSGIAVGSCRM